MLLMAVDLHLFMVLTMAVALLRPLCRAKVQVFLP